MRFNWILLLTLIFMTCPAAYGRKQAHEHSNTVNIETTITAVSSAELNISDKRVFLSTSWGPKILSPTSLELRKANLIVDLCRQVGADVLVDPQFIYTKRFLGGGKLSVSGYPATYKNFRTMTDKEVDAFISTPEYETGKVVFINKN